MESFGQKKAPLWRFWDDFAESMKDPQYKITYGPSKKRLQEYNLVDANGKIIQKVREALKNRYSK